MARNRRSHRSQPTLKLVASNQPATMDDFADIEFEPLASPGEELTPTDDMLASIGFDLRTAHAILTRSKQELVDGFHDGAEVGASTLGRLMLLGPALDDLADMADDAAARLASAMAVIVGEG